MFWIKYILNSLDRPLKRICFVVLIPNLLFILGLSVLPYPVVEFSQRTLNWSDSDEIGSTEHVITNLDKRVITRIDTQCAENAYPGSSSFIINIAIIETVIGDPNNRCGPRRPGLLNLCDVPYLSEKLEAAKAKTSIDYTDEDITKFRDKISEKEVNLCYDGICVSELNIEIFENVLKSCGHSVVQNRIVHHWKEWVIAKNISNTNPWSLISLFLAGTCIFICWIRDWTLRPLIRWIRHG